MATGGLLPERLNIGMRTDHDIAAEYEARIKAIDVEIPRLIDRLHELQIALEELPSSTDDMTTLAAIEAREEADRAFMSYVRSATPEKKRLRFLIAAYEAGEPITLAKLRYVDGMTYPGR